MVSTTPHKILLVGDPGYEEDVAGGTITPGQLIALASTGKVVVHSTAGGICEHNFAIEDALQGKTIDDDYEADSVCRYVTCEGTEVIYALLGDGENVAIGDHLSSDGTGNLRKVVGTDHVVAVALEAKDLSVSSNTTAKRIRVRVL